MKSISLAFLGFLFLSSCSGKPTYDDAMLEKYPNCYHINFKIYKKCIEQNEAGKTVTATDIENAAYPGQYK